MCKCHFRPKYYGKIEFSDRLLTWDNINITLSAGNYSDIGFHSRPEISALIDYGNGTSCPSDWGVIEEDNGIFLQPIDGVVTLYWIPTNETIGEWDFT